MTISQKAARLILTAWVVVAAFAFPSKAQYATPDFTRAAYTSNVFATSGGSLVGQCTWYTYGRLLETGSASQQTLDLTVYDARIPGTRQIFVRNASTWLSDAIEVGLSWGTQPRPGAIATWSSQNHVAFVENALGQVTESNNAPLPDREVLVGGALARMRSATDPTASLVWEIPQFTVLSVNSGPTSVINGYKWFQLTGQGRTGWIAWLKADLSGPAEQSGANNLWWNITRIRRHPGSSFITSAPTYIYVAPQLTAFSSAPSTQYLGSAVAINYTVASSGGSTPNGGSRLNRIVLRRTSGDGSDLDPGWHDIATQAASGNGPISGSFSDTPAAVGSYWYGLAVFDNLGNSINERQAGIGPKQVTISPAICPAFSTAGSTGAFSEKTACGLPPSAVTNAATSVASTSATLNGSVNPNNLATTAYFDYGFATTNLNQTVTYGPVGSGGSSSSVASPVYNLACGTTYYFRLRVASSAGTSNGSTLSFTTSACATAPPSVTTAAAISTTQTSATLNGSVNPNGTSTTAYFDYGLTTSLGQSVAYGAVGAGSSNVQISSLISNLTCGTSYYFRARASNSGGTTNGSMLSFATNACSISGACGSSSGGTFTSAPSTNLCSSGVAGAVTGSGPWTWNCNGVNGGTNASCSANRGTASPPAINSPSTASGMVNQPFSYQITASNSPASYGVTNAPLWLTVNAATGLVTGTPTASGSFAVTVSASNSAGTGTAPLTITINNPTINTGDVVIKSSGSNTGGAWVGNTWTPISTASSVLASEVASRLATGTTVITTSADGDIVVDAPISWNANTTLRLASGRDIKVNGNITATGGGAGLVLNYGPGHNYRLANGASITLSSGAPTLRIGVTGADEAYAVINNVGGPGDTNGTTLQGMSGNLSGRYALGSNLDAGATSSWSAGAGFTPIEPFTGQFHGLGHTIGNLAINWPSKVYVGLFGYMAPGSGIRDVGLIGGRVIGAQGVGALAGTSQGSISNSYTQTNVTGGVSDSGNSARVGGLVGMNLGTIASSYATGNVDASGDGVGGLVGWNTGAVADSYATGDISGRNHVGGLVGIAGGSISTSYAVGNVTGTAYAGGLVGTNNGTLDNTFATGDVAASGYITGGLAGYNGGSIHTSYAGGKSSGTSYVGGLVGEDFNNTSANSGTITQSYWDVQTSGLVTGFVSVNGPANADATGLTSAQMVTQASFVGFDFTGIWRISEGNTRPLLRNVASPPTSKPTITSSFTASGAVNQAFNYQITASDYPTSFGATGLPPGLTVTASSGLISGKPSSGGTFGSTISATNVAGTRSATLTMTIAAIPLAPVFVLTPTLYNFGSVQVGANSGQQTFTLRNSGSSGTVTLVAITGANANNFSITSNTCLGTISTDSSCTIVVAFIPTALGVRNATLTIATGAGDRVATASLMGAALSNSVSFDANVNAVVTGYYETILGRSPDSGGASFWSSEASRVKNLGADVREVFFAMSLYFFNSPEYRARNTSDTQYVTDLYKTFLVRDPDAAGLAYWKSQLEAGMDRGALLNNFLFAQEFSNLITGIFGENRVRSEVDLTIDLYRGILGVLPDSEGFNFWLRQIRTAQCQGAAAVVIAVGNLATSFVNSVEYQQREAARPLSERTKRHVGDLYNAFMRRGADIAGYNFWVNVIASGAQTRDAVRGQFVHSPEFQMRANRVAAESCILR